MAEKLCASSARTRSSSHIEPIECLKLTPRKSILKSLTSPLEELCDTDDDATTTTTQEGKFRKIASAPHFDEMNIRATHHHHHHHHHHLHRLRREQMEKLGRGRLLSLQDSSDVVPSNSDEMARKSDECRHRSDKETVDAALKRSEDEHHDDVCWDDDQSSSSSSGDGESEGEECQLHVAKRKEMHDSEGLALKFGKILIDNEADEIEGDKD